MKENCLEFNKLQKMASELLILLNTVRAIDDVKSCLKSCKTSLVYLKGILIIFKK